MAAVVPTYVEYHNLPTSLSYGSTGLRLAEVLIAASSATASDTIALATYLPNVQSIQCVEAYTVAGAATAVTNLTWSSTTLTTASTGLNQGIKLLVAF